jgi:hypothetical protein
MTSTIFSPMFRKHFFASRIQFEGVTVGSSVLLNLFLAAFFARNSKVAESDNFRE